MVQRLGLGSDLLNLRNLTNLWILLFGIWAKLASHSPPAQSYRETLPGDAMQYLL